MSENKTQGLIPTEKIAKELDLAVSTVVGSAGISGFERSYLLASGISKLKEMLTPEYMSPIMKMQGNKLGFRTDKDKSGGYDMETVKNCVVEAVLMGLQVYGNQFNIIAGNMYMTKEGAGYILNNFKGLKYDIVLSLPKIVGDSAAVEATINWEIKGEKKEKVIPIAIRVNSGMGVDAVMGKATRKARAWLISTLTGIEAPEGDAEDAKYTVVSSNIKKSDADFEKERILALIKEAATTAELEFYFDNVKASDNEVQDAYTQKHKELTKAKK